MHWFLDQDAAVEVTRVDQDLMEVYTCAVFIQFLNMIKRSDDREFQRNIVTAEAPRFW